MTRISTDSAYKMLQIKQSTWPTAYDLKKIWHPEWFQGNRKTRNYFEGWYIKNVSAPGEDTIAFIPGISMGAGGDHAFVQVISGKTGETWYFKFPPEDFLYAPDKFAVRVGHNSFSAEGIELDLKSETDHITGTLKFSKHVKFPVSFKRPGIMGWYRYVPLMECYHGVVSLDHDVTGKIIINEEKTDFSGGKGYIEKDWGSSMPEAWIWMQSNNFEQPGASFMLSVARIPWIKKTFPGFLGFLLSNNKQTHFATYTGAKIKSLEREGDHLTICIEGKDFFLHIHGEKETTTQRKGALKAPMQGQMDRVIHESVDARLHVVLTNKQGLPLFEGTGKNAGLEMTGDTSLLQAQT